MDCRNITATVQVRDDGSLGQTGNVEKESRGQIGGVFGKRVDHNY